MGLFDTIPAKLPRWTYNASGTETAGASSEPADGLKTTGWVPGRPTRTAMNWLLGVTYHWLGYFDAAFGRLFDENFVMRGGASTDMEVTLTRVGASPPYTWDVDVADGKYWAAGDMYENASFTTVNVAPHATLNRIDYVVASPDGVEVKQGTPDVSPVAPTLDADEVLLAEYTILPGSVSITPTDHREFGAFLQSRLGASKIFRAGYRVATLNWNIEVLQEDDSVSMRGTDLTTFFSNDWTATAQNDWTVTVGNDWDTTVAGAWSLVVTGTGVLTTGGLTVNGTVTFNNQVTVDKDDGIGLSATVNQTRKYPPVALVPTEGVSFTGGGAQADGTFDMNTTDEAHLWLQIPEGSTLTGISVTGTADSAGDFLLELVYYSGSATGSAAFNDTEAITSGSFTASVSPSRLYNQSAECLMLRISTDGSAAATITDIEITYTTPKIIPQ